MDGLKEQLEPLYLYPREKTGYVLLLCQNGSQRID